MTKEIKICVERVWFHELGKYHLEKNPVAKIELHEEKDYRCYAIATLDKKDLAKFINWMIDNVADVVIERKDGYDFGMIIYDDYME